MLKELAKLGDKLDSLGLFKEASFIDKVLSKIAQDDVSDVSNDLVRSGMVPISSSNPALSQGQQGQQGSEPNLHRFLTELKSGTFTNSDFFYPVKNFGLNEMGVSTINYLTGVLNENPGRFENMKGNFGGSNLVSNMREWLSQANSEAKDYCNQNPQNCQRVTEFIDALKNFQITFVRIAGGGVEYSAFDILPYRSPEAKKSQNVNPWIAYSNAVRDTGMSIKATWEERAKAMGTDASFASYKKWLNATSNYGTENLSVADVLEQLKAEIKHAEMRRYISSKSSI